MFESFVENFGSNICRELFTHVTVLLRHDLQSINSES